MFAVIFDMDGVIVDDQEYHYKAWQIFLQQYDLSITKKMLREEIFGKGNKEIFNILFNNVSTEEDSYLMAEEKEKIFRKVYKNNVILVKGLPEFINELKKNRIAIAIATSAPPGNVNFVLQETGLNHSFDVIIDASQVMKSKPDPEVFLKAANALKINPGNCIAIEDSRSGIQSALTAGMKVIAITTSLKAEQISGADLVIDDFTELDIRKLKSLLR